MYGIVEYRLKRKLNDCMNEPSEQYLNAWLNRQLNSYLTERLNERLIVKLDELCFDA